LELLPFWLVMIGMVVTGTVLFLTPWIFKKTSRRALTIIAWIVMAYLVITTVFGHVIYEIVKGVKP